MVNTVFLTLVYRNLPNALEITVNLIE
uniref:Uncharacterized protein n=1 Tax=Anguilla anguilla TaxID=7936 RepID=A0A0E9WDT9_ANGAN